MAIAENITSPPVASPSTAPAKTGEVVQHSPFRGKITLFGMAIIFAVAVFSRWYQGWASWEYGTDSTHPDFDKYWMNFLYIELVLIATLIAISVSYLWLTRDRHLDQLKPEEELGRYMTLVAWFTVYAFSFVFAGSFFAEQDAAWHQVVVRDTSFTPSHIILFYGWVPFFIFFGATTFMYATTRLPLYAKGFSLPLVMGVTGPFMILPAVGFNEWGHAFWFMEEYFTAPLHWAFVVFGWSILGLGGILVQVLSRLSVLIGQVHDTELSGPQ